MVVTWWIVAFLHSDYNIKLYLQALIIKVETTHQDARQDGINCPLKGKTLTIAPEII